MLNSKIIDIIYIHLYNSRSLLYEKYIIMIKINIIVIKSTFIINISDYVRKYVILKYKKD